MQPMRNVPNPMTQPTVLRACVHLVSESSSIPRPRGRSKVDAQEVEGALEPDCPNALADVVQVHLLEEPVEVADVDPAPQRALLGVHARRPPPARDDAAERPSAAA